MTGFFAITFRGLEEIAADEIIQISGAAIDRQIYRQVHFDLHANFDALLQLRTVDDLFVTVAHWQPVTRQRTSLDLIAEESASMSLERAMTVIDSIRKLPATPRFSVTANFVGKRNYTSAEIKQRVADAITATRQWLYTADDQQAELNIRVFIEGDTAEVGVRLAKRPLHIRSQYHDPQPNHPQLNGDQNPSGYPGSLKPPLAAAMIHLADPQASQLLLDPCCGSGTILLESLSMGLQAMGGDISSLAAKACRQRGLDIRQWDVRALPLEDSSVDRIVSNLPWGDQTAIKADSSGFYRHACREMERVLTAKGKIVLLTTLSEKLQFTSLKLEMMKEVSLFGKRPTIMKFAMG